MKIDIDTRARAESIIGSSPKVEERLDKLGNISRKEIEEIASKYSTSPSTYLAAIVGGVLGAYGGVTLAGFTHSWTTIAGPSGMLLGAALSVLMWRGPKTWKLERAQDNYEKAIKPIEDAINTLPKDADSSIRDKLLEKKIELLELLQGVSGEAISDIEKPAIMGDEIGDALIVPAKTVSSKDDDSQNANND